MIDSRGLVFALAMFVVLVVPSSAVSTSIDAVEFARQTHRARAPWPHAPVSVALVGSWAPVGAEWDAYVCAGVEHEPGVVLTAAHCVTESASGDLDILGPTNDICAAGDRRPVRRIDLHPDFDSVTWEADVAVLRVDPGPYDRSVAIAGRDVQSRGVVVGWGPIRYQQVRPCMATAGALELMDSGVCAKSRGTRAVRRERSTVLCGRSPQDLIGDACPGDSGGPVLVWDEASSQVRVLALVSWGRACGESTSPSGFTHLAAVLPWIQSVISQHQSTAP